MCALLCGIKERQTAQRGESAQLPGHTGRREGCYEVELHRMLSDWRLPGSRAPTLSPLLALVLLGT